MKFKELTPKYFSFLLEKGFAKPVYISRGLIENFSYESKDYGFRISYDSRDNMVSVYLYSLNYKDSRFENAPKEVHLWTYLKRVLSRKIELRSKNKGGLEGELEQAACLVLDYFPEIESKADEYFESK